LQHVSALSPANLRLPLDYYLHAQVRQYDYDNNNMVVYPFTLYQTFHAMLTGP
jgi:hypothetical protein